MKDIYYQKHSAIWWNVSGQMGTYLSQHGDDIRAAYPDRQVRYDMLIMEVWEQWLNLPKSQEEARKILFDSWCDEIAAYFDRLDNPVSLSSTTDWIAAYTELYHMISTDILWYMYNAHEGFFFN